MRRALLLIISLFFALSLHAQSSDTLTNSTILRMAKAQLADELIIDVIQSSIVQFDLSEKQLKSLRENVSDPVIEAMKEAQSKQLPLPIAMENERNKDENKSNPEIAVEKNYTQIPPVAETPPVSIQPVTETASAAKTAPQPNPSFQAAPTSITDHNSTLNNLDFTAFSYVAPIGQLLTFIEKESNDLTKYIENWDTQIKLSIAKINEIEKQIDLKEKELREKKNIDSKRYSAEVNALKLQLNELRIRYKQVKTQVIEDGLAITKKLQEIRENEISAVKNTYNLTSQQIKSFETDPSQGTKPTQIKLSGIKFSQNIADYILPLTELEIWHFNLLSEINAMIPTWNKKVEYISNRDKEINLQTEPLKAKLESYKSDSKLYKSEISSLKKQISAKEKERKQLANQMESDAKELADFFKQSRNEVQLIIEERYTDVINNISYSYQEKLKL
ncbi:MAG: hypothetical protein H6541_10810 [Lentimicrobiaceae bacterium]|nr:hypothetical protein [Lentimicrobiaceae bacterium]MCB9023758.1 hypothetical protein [Lentimicrobiaceae bacterium]MCO5265311.1 hypothetical protein [Lentimicrobium sp.]